MSDDSEKTVPRQVREIRISAIKQEGAVGSSEDMFYNAGHNDGRLAGSYPEDCGFKSHPCY